MNKKASIYVDTSVPNHYFADDTPERMEVTKHFFGALKEKQDVCQIFISEIVLREIEKAPVAKREQLLNLLKGSVILEVTEECERLAQEYIKAKIIPPRSEADAIHIATASVYNVELLVSWNFEHIVNIRTRKQANAVNELMGYSRIEIITPEEVNLNEWP